MMSASAWVCVYMRACMRVCMCTCMCVCVCVCVCYLRWRVLQLVFVWTIQAPLWLWLYFLLTVYLLDFIMFLFKLSEWNCIVLLTYVLFIIGQRQTTEFPFLQINKGFIVLHADYWNEWQKCHLDFKKVAVLIWYVVLVNRLINWCKTVIVTTTCGYCCAVCIYLKNKSWNKVYCWHSKTRSKCTKWLKRTHNHTIQNIAHFHCKHPFYATSW